MNILYFQDAVAELFQDDGDDERGGGQSPTPSTQYAFPANAGYEIPARLRTLHNLVIQYASQGDQEPLIYVFNTLQDNTIFISIIIYKINFNKCFQDGMRLLFLCVNRL